MNLGLSEYLKSFFKNHSPVERPLIKTENITNPNWISGFVSAEGNFYVRFGPQPNNKYRVQLRFIISQHERDEKLIECIIKFLGIGIFY